MALKRITEPLNILAGDLSIPLNSRVGNNDSAKGVTPVKEASGSEFPMIRLYFESIQVPC